jgi:hypothetical protein
LGKKRIDGLHKLTAEQKAERDARAQYWMNQRKIVRVAEVSARSGWGVFTAELVESLIEDEASYISEEDGELVLVLVDVHRMVREHYRIHGYEPKTLMYKVRRIETEKINGDNA